MLAFFLITRYFLDALSFSSFTNINIVDDKIFKFIGQVHEEILF